MKKPQPFFDSALRSFDKPTSAQCSHSSSLLMSQLNRSDDRLQPSNCFPAHFSWESPQCEGSVNEVLEISTPTPDKLSHKLHALRLELEEANGQSTREADFAKPAEPCGTLSSELSPTIPRLRWCPFCCKETLVCAEYRPTAKPFWAALGIFVSGGVLGCFALPYLSRSCQQAALVCRTCNHSLHI